MTPLRERVIGALALQPMTKRELARCLSSSYGCVQSAMSDQRMRGRIRIVSKVQHGKSRPDWVWGLAARGEVRP